MSATIKCDGCGKEARMEAGPHGNWFKPVKWYQRSDEDGIQDACSRDCIDKIAQKSGKTAVVLPI